MGKPNSQADLAAQKANTVDLFTGDIEDARRKKVVLLNLIDDQSKRALPGVESFVLHDLEDCGAEDTKTDGSKQSDLSGGSLPTTLKIDKFKTVPAYFKYVFGESSRIDWVKAFLMQAPKVAILEVEKAAVAALRGIGATAGRYIQLGGTNSQGVANSVPTRANYVAALKILNDMDFDTEELRSIGSTTGQYELPDIFGLYDPAATSALGDTAKLKGFLREIMSVPHFVSGLIRNYEHIIFHPRAVAWAIRTQATLKFQGLASESRDYYGVNISYGVVARQDARAVIMQNGAAFTA